MELDTQIPKGEDISLRLDTSKKFLKYTIDDETSCFDIFFWKTQFILLMTLIKVLLF